MAEEVMADAIVDADGLPVRAPEAPQPPAGTQEEMPVSEWEKAGYLSELAHLCEGLTELKEEHLYPSAIRQIIDSISNAKTVQDFDGYSNDRLQRMIQQLRNDVPRIERDVVTFVSQVSRARSVATVVDFI